MIYKTFEQWKSGNVLEHGVSRTEHYSEDQLDLVEMGWMYGYDAGRAVEQALDKRAENARELGLDYEPVLDVSLIDEGKTAAPVQEPVALEEYDAGLLNDYGGGNVEWWQDYIRAELGRAYEHYQSQITTPPAQPAPVQEPVGEKEISAWAERHDIQGTPTDLRSMFEDAASFTAPPAQPAPVQPVWIQPDHLQKAQKAPFLCRVEPHKRDDFVPLHTTPPAAQPAPVQEPDHGDELTIAYMSGLHDGKKLAAQPAVPDAIHHTDLSEHPQYIEGWNDCRAEMLKGMK